MEKYRDLLVYQRAYRLAVNMYKYTQSMPTHERYGLTSQIQRAATSIALNIAEGYGKSESKPELKRYLKMSKGSSAEMSVLIDLCKDIGYMEEAVYAKYADEIEQIGKMLHRLIRSIN